MRAYDSYLNDLVNKTRDDFKEFPGIKWMNPYEAWELLEKRSTLISENSQSSFFKETKPYYKQISQGCRLCGQGLWSCLFITSKCNASCFYCPAPQVADEPPSSQGLTFETPDDYAEYINFFKFKGVSFSGGEPLLFIDRTLAYLKKIREKCDPGIYIWAYTNGILADDQKFDDLAAAGLDEIRFDIGATGYKLDKIRFAKGKIPTITIEIPAVPEEKERLISMLPKMTEAGVTNLNLHQLRLTKHNAPKLLKHDYTYIAAERPIVLESEIAALEIIKAARETGISIGINYCSFFFKNRFQKAGFRRQVANALSPFGTPITEKGFIRESTATTLGYRTIALSDYQGQDELLKIGAKFYSAVTGYAKKPVESGDPERVLSTLLESIPAEPGLFGLWQFETIESGLREL